MASKPVVTESRELSHLRWLLLIGADPKLVVQALLAVGEKSGEDGEHS